jgi:hypothetical protein
MKLKLTYFSLVLFVLLHIALSNLSLKSEKLTRSKSHIHKEKNSHLKDHSKYDHHRRRVLRSDKPSSSNEGFFTKTSKKNQSTAAKALSAFILGIILYICSIHFICWNERRAVKETEFIDFIRQEKKCIFLENAKIIEDKPENENKVFLVNGPASVTQEPKVDNLPLEITSTRGKICVIKTVFEKFSKITQVNEEEVGEDEEGNTLVRGEEKTTRNWFKTDYTNNRFTSKVYYGEVLIGGKYSFPMENLKSEVDKNQTTSLADNFNIYRPTENDISILDEYFKIENNDTNKPYKILIKDQFIYILRSNIPESSTLTSTFNPETYEFSDSDIRMSIKYHFIPTEETIYTVAGKLSKENEKGIRTISTFKTNLKKAGCSYFCCCCADDDTYYEVNLLYTKKMSRDDIVNDLEQQNKACTCCARIGGFLMHFLAVYLILYPLILLIGMIPFLGAIGATILIFFAFIFALMTFLFVIACAWICARPVYAVLIFGFIFILMFVGKSSRDHLNNQEENDGRGGYFYGNQNNYAGNNNTMAMNNRPKRKFL